MIDHNLPPTGDPIEILLVEDNPGDVRLTKEAFKSSEQETELHAVTDGDEAIDRLCEQADHGPEAIPDMVLVDLDLPGHDGCEVLEAIRAHAQLKLLPIIILTGSSADEDIERCYDANANAYLTKPTGIDDFESLVENVEQFWFRHAELPPIPA